MIHLRRGAHQPNFFPWIGYFDKLSKADRFVFADLVQFSTGSYTNRTRIKSAGGKQWLTVPVLSKGHGLQVIRDLRIDNSRNWKGKHLKTLYLNYKKATYFDCYFSFFEQTYQKEWSYLVDGK
jgi:hypothetical protein